MGKTSKRRPRPARTSVWRRPVADPTGPEQALQDAKSRLLLAGIGNVDEADLAPLRETVETAQAEVDACYEQVVFTGLRADAFEELMLEHPANDAEQEDGRHYNAATFLPAVCEASADNGWTLEDWTDEIDSMTVGERRELRESVMEASTRPWSEAIPKG